MQELLFEESLEGIAMWKRIFLALGGRSGEDINALLGRIQPDEEAQAAVRCLAKWLLDDPRMEMFLRKGGTEEALFAIAIIHLGPLLDFVIEPSKELRHLLGYPTDDLALAYCLARVLKLPRREEDVGRMSRIKELMANEGSIRQEVLAKAEALVNAWIHQGEVKVDMIQQNLEQQNDQGLTGDARLGRLRHAFATSFDIHHLFKLDRSKDARQCYYDDCAGVLFALHPASLASREKPQFSVYARLKKAGDGSNYADFVAHVSEHSSIARDSTFHSLISIDVSVGPAVAKRLATLVKTLRSASKGLNTPSTFYFEHYDPCRCLLTVLCDAKKKDAAMEFIHRAMRHVKDSHGMKHVRRVYLKKLGATATIGLGLETLDVAAVDERAGPTALLFEAKKKEGHARTMKKEDFAELFARISERNTNVRYATRSGSAGGKEAGPAFVAIMPTADQCSTVAQAAQSWDYQVKTISAKDVERWKPMKQAPASTPTFHVPGDGTIAPPVCLICTIPCAEAWLHLRLCGHPYCLGCATRMMECADKFPLQCVSPTCPGVLFLEDIDVILGNKGSREALDFIVPILDKSVRAYIGEGLLVSNKGFKDCKRCGHILQCPSFLTWTIHGSMPAHQVVCPGCGTSRCAACGFDYHLNETCQESHARRIYADEAMINWRRGDEENRSFCPNLACHSLIEKTGGCNHMECVICGQHFCWMCKHKGAAAREIYEHLQQAHGGNGLPEDFLPEDAFAIGDANVNVVGA